MHDLAIVGAGPAGASAAATAAEFGLNVLLIDDQPSPGGQIYRGIERSAADNLQGRDDLAGRSLYRELRASAVNYRPATAVWHIDPAAPEGARLSIVSEDASATFAARHVLLATGAIERPVPIPGWTLPGVMTVGAAQILLKTADLVPDGRVVLAGQGPLLYLVARQLAAAGVTPVAILQTTPAANRAAAASHIPSLWAGRRDTARGMALLGGLWGSGSIRHRAVAELRAVGRRRLESVAWDGGAVEAEHLLLHEGVIPNTQISLALGLEHRWDDAQLCWRPTLDEWGRTSLPTISIAGDGGGIAGAESAGISGRLAALDIAAALDRLDPAERDRRARPLRSALARAKAIRPFLDALYRPAPAILDPPSDVVICRCEEITAGQVRRAVRLGATGPNQVKAFLRCGMGPCQGRMCGPVVGPVIAAARGVPIGEVGTYRPRAPYKPVTVGTLAAADLAPTS